MKAGSRMNELRARWRIWNERRVAWEIEAGYRLCEWMCRRLRWEDVSCREGADA